jgi:hypothetical protein
MRRCGANHRYVIVHGPQLQPSLYMLSTEMYAPVLGQSPTIDSLFLRLRRKLVSELRLQNDLVKTKGALDMLFAFAALSA